MIKIENIEVIGLRAAIRGMRNPMNSWDKSDSGLGCDSGQCEKCTFSPVWCGNSQKTTIGLNDHDLMMRLAKQGSVHGKFRRMITVYMDVTAPLYWWKEFDTYKVGTVANSCSTMHKIHAKEFTLDDFSYEHLMELEGQSTPLTSEVIYAYDYIKVLQNTINALNIARSHYLETKDKQWWWQMIQLLPSSYNQRRTVMLNYEVLANMYKYRHDHKLDEWKIFCQTIKELPYSEIITCRGETS